MWQVRVSVDAATLAAPGEEGKLHAPDGGVVVGGDEGGEGEGLRAHGAGEYGAVAALLSEAAQPKAEPEPEPEPESEPESEPATSEADEARAKRLAAMQAEMAAYGAAISK